MTAPGIAIATAPPLWVPLRFLLTAPWFGVLAAALLIWSGPAAFESRWTPAMLGATHLLTLGFMTMAMVGALFQLMPVVTGALLPRSRLLASAVHALLTAGTLLLAGGLTFGSSEAVGLAVGLLVSGLGSFVALALRALWRAAPGQATGRNIAIAVTALAVTVILGAMLGAALGFGLPVPVAKLVDLHAAWGLMGWTALLVVAVAQQVVPMFQVTPQYPRGLSVAFAPLVLVALTVWSIASWLEAREPARLLEAALAAMMLLFSLLTVVLQGRSRRPRSDATTLAWRAGMICLALAAVIASSATYIEAPSQPLAVLIGVLTIVGFALSVIQGMLYKVVPFLLWLHLQNRIGGRVPHVRLILPDAAARRHLYLHLAAVALLCAAAVYPQSFLYVGAGTLAVANATLAWTLARACRWAAWRPV